MTSTTSAPTRSSSVATVRTPQSRSTAVMPLGSGVPVPGMNAGSRSRRRPSGRPARRRGEKPAPPQEGRCQLLAELVELHETRALLSNGQRRPEGLVDVVLARARGHRALALGLWPRTTYLAPEGATVIGAGLGRRQKRGGH